MTVPLPKAASAQRQERKPKIYGRIFSVFDEDQYIGSIAPMEYGWLVIDTDEEAFALCRTRADAAEMLLRNYFPN
jgi:hypothetical protein